MVTHHATATTIVAEDPGLPSVRDSVREDPQGHEHHALCVLSVHGKISSIIRQLHHLR